MDAIDQHSQHAFVTEIDFFAFRPPSNKQYDVVSLSLVVNFVGDAKKRGEMLFKVRAAVAANCAAKPHGPSAPQS